MAKIEISVPSRTAEDVRWNASCLNPDKVCLEFWRAGFDFQDDDPARWKDVSDVIKKYTPVLAKDEFLDDIYFAIWGFRNDYAEEKLRAITREKLEKNRKRQIKICKQAVSALDSLPVLGDDFRKMGEPLHLALRAYLKDLSSKTNFSPGRARKAERARDILILTLADRWLAHTKKPCEGEAWHDFIQRVVVASGYKNDECAVEHLLRHATKKYKGAKLYLRRGKLMQHGYVFGLR